ncbi:MAG: DUF1552 domain-containing protein [Planctomycetes bacterium]|nr:DUF1552 domain-containing protein [Planctomycetota bacterium]
MTPISRRTALKGLGVSVALPFLEAMLPQSLFAQAGSAAQRLPRRMAFLYVPNGVHVPDWTPTADGRAFELPRTLRPLAAVKDDLLVFTGLTVDKARPNGDGPGDHARAMSAFLTGCQPRKTSGADIRAGVSVDQLAARHATTRFPSLEVGCEAGAQAGNCDSGYSCAYSANISWRGEATPQPKEINPRAVFDRLFAGPAQGQAAQRDLFNRSILDFVREDANALRRRLGAADLQRVDEYLTSIREIEQRIERNRTAPASALPSPLRGEGLGAALPSPLRGEGLGVRGIPAEYRDHLRLMADLLVLAFQGDVTRIATFVFANEGSNRPYRNINISDGHHDLSHHGNNREKQERIARINKFHIEQFAYLLKRLKHIREGEGGLLDNCMILYGSGNGDGNAHNHDNLPILLAGKGGGTLSTGRHIRYPHNTPLCNLYLDMLDRMGVQAERFGDSTGLLRGLTV